MANRRGQSCILPNVTQVGVEKGEGVGRRLEVSALRDGHMLTPFSQWSGERLGGWETEG